MVDGIGHLLDFIQSLLEPLFGFRFVVSFRVSSHREPLAKGGGPILGKLMTDSLPGLDRSDRTERSIAQDGAKGEGVVGVQSADSQEDWFCLPKLAGALLEGMEVSGPEDDAAGESGVSLQEIVCHPSSFAEARDIDPLVVEFVLGLEVTASGVEVLAFFVDVLRRRGNVARFGVGHPDHNPVLVVDMSPNEFGGWGASGAMIVEDGRPGLGLIVVLRKNDLNALFEIWESKINAFSLAQQGGCERKECEQRAHSATIGESRSWARNWFSSAVRIGVCKVVIDVVCAVLVREGEVLLCQRPSGKHLAGCWEFPGGKVEGGETFEDALVREIMEELDCRVSVAETLPLVEHAYPEVSIRLHAFRCTLESGEPEALEHAEVSWFPIAESFSCELAEADRAVWALARPKLKC